LAIRNHGSGRKQTFFLHDGKEIKIKANAKSTILFIVWNKMQLVSQFSLRLKVRINFLCRIPGILQYIDGKLLKIDAIRLKTKEFFLFLIHYQLKLKTI